MVLASSALAQGGAFSDEERTTLTGGGLVRRDLTRREGGRTLYGGASWQFIEVPLDQVWQSVTDIATLPRVIPALDTAYLVQDNGDQRVLYFHHRSGIAETAYHVRMDLNRPDHSIRFALDTSRPHDMRDGHGSLRLTPYHGGTIVEWGILVDLGGGMVMDLFAPIVSEWMLVPPRCLRDILEPGRTPSC